MFPIVKEVVVPVTMHPIMKERLMKFMIDINPTIIPRNVSEGSSGF